MRRRRSDAFEIARLALILGVIAYFTFRLIMSDEPSDAIRARRGVSLFDSE